MQKLNLSNLPKACLGTMNFGSITDEKTSFEIMDTALEMGCYFFDTAEMYSVPTTEETTGLSEKIIGKWMKNRKNRNKIFLATKITGPERGNAPWIRGGKERCFNEKNIREALQGSLDRLQTDYIDLYQLHWPNRDVNIFGTRNFSYTRNTNNIEITEIQETLRILQKLQQEGLIKYFGISNETPWGVSEFQRLEREENLPKMQSIQNNYNLLTRTFETALSEFSFNTGLGLLAHSPLAFGALVDSQRKNGRFNTYTKSSLRYRTERVKKIVEKYKALAHSHGLTLPQLAISFVASKPFVNSVIIGPATVEQTRDAILATQQVLPENILQEIDIIHEEHPNVCPQ